MTIGNKPVPETYDGRNIIASMRLTGNKVYPDKVALVCRVHPHHEFELIILGSGSYTKNEWAVIQNLGHMTWEKAMREFQRNGDLSWAWPVTQEMSWN